MSFQTLGNRDDINTMFQELNKNTSSFDSTYTDSTLNANFKIVGLKAQAFYSNHHQKESYVDKLVANVTMGVIDVASTFKY